MMQSTKGAVLALRIRQRVASQQQTGLRSFGAGGGKAQGTGDGLPTEMPPTADEAPIPPPESTTESMMPNEHWFSNFLRSQLGDERYETLRKTILYAPDDIHHLHGVPNPSTKVPLTKDGKVTAQFRYPSPGSRKPVNIPTSDEGDPYFIAHYVQDNRRRGSDPAYRYPEVEQMKLELLPEDDPRVQEAKEKLEAGPGSSPGNKGVFATGKSDYDPSGLRAAMSTNWESMNKELDRHAPDHLPKVCWDGQQDEIIEFWESKGLPVPIGKSDFSTVPVERRVARWGDSFGGGIFDEDPLNLDAPKIRD